MKIIDDNLVMSSEVFREAYKSFLLESNERKRNELFNKVIPTIDKQIAFVFFHLGIKNPDLESELIQLSHIKIFTKVTLERVFIIRHFSGYVLTIVLNTVKDYFKASNNYEKYKRRFKLMLENETEKSGKHFVFDDETPQSDHIIFVDDREKR